MMLITIYIIKLITNPTFPTFPQYHSPNFLPPMLHPSSLRWRHQDPPEASPEGRAAGRERHLPAASIAGMPSPGGEAGAPAAGAGLAGARPERYR